MARQGLMDDSGYDFLEPTDCSNFETCSEVAYQQGIEDERPKAFGKGYDSGYQQGRADAIEEFKDNLLNGELYRCTDGNEYVDVADVEYVAEQLKEQINE